MPRHKNHSHSNPASSGYVLGNPVTYTISVQSFQGGTPIGVVNVTENGVNKCSNLTLVNGQVTCNITYSSFNTYPVSVTYTSSNNIYKNAGPTVYYYYAWPSPSTPPSTCPQPGAVSFSTAQQLRFPITGKSVSQSINEIDVYWPNSTQAELTQINLLNGSNSTNLYTSEGLAPTVAFIPFGSPVGSIPKNGTRTLAIVFDHTLGTGTYVVQVKFSENNCVLTVSGTK